MLQVKRWRPIVLLLIFVMGWSPRESWGAGITADFAVQLQQAQFAAAEADLQKRLVVEPGDSQVRFALGLVQFLSAIQHLGQEQYRYGFLNGQIRNLPVLRLSVPQNPHPEQIRYEQVRQIFSDFQQRLVQAEAELAKLDVKQDVKLPVELSSIRFDMQGDGTIENRVSFLDIFSAVNGGRRDAIPPDLSVVFDAGDVPWLRGYCHFLAGFCDVVLAYDHQKLFNHAGQILYPRHVSSQPFTEPLDLDGKSDEWMLETLDLVAGIHLLNLPLKEPHRMETARQHFLEMIRTSRQSWELIQAETDNDREWLPNPKQTGVLRIPVSREMIAGWHAVLSEMEELLEGRKLVPFWRDHLTSVIDSNSDEQKSDADVAEEKMLRGMNLKRFFSEPRDFDLILLIQGSGALPYLERGKLSSPESWGEMTRVFRGQFFGFAAWFN